MKTESGRRTRGGEGPQVVNKSIYALYNGNMTDATSRIRGSCHNCRFGGQYECRRHAPVAGDPTHGPVFPSIYCNGLGTWCGDYEPQDFFAESKEKRMKRILLDAVAALGGLNALADRCPALAREIRMLNTEENT